MASYIIHKAIELNKLSAKNKPIDIETFSWQPKVDGCNCVVIVQRSGVEMLSRTGETVKSAEHIKEDFRNKLPGVYLGEYVIPNVDYAKTSGAFRHTKKQFPEAVLYVFDVLLIQEWEAGAAPAWNKRRERLQYVQQGSSVQVLFPGTKESTIQFMHNHPELGYDGMIARAPSGKWVKGSSGKGGEIIKIKNALSLDLEVVSILTAIGEKTGREVFNLELKMGGKIINVGSGVPHKRKDLPAVGDIVEVEALGYTSGGLLREPRFKAIRYDKLETDS